MLDLPKDHPARPHLKRIALSSAGQGAFRFLALVYYPYGKIRSYLRLLTNSGKPSRRLEIGPGPKRIDGFETLDVVARPTVDYVFDAARPLPFKDATFDTVYASHIIEHIPWYKVADVLKEWVRVLKPGGMLEIWTPDGLKIAQAFVEAEAGGSQRYKEDAWFKWNEDEDPCVWASGRLYTYGDGSGNVNHPNWHRAMFSERYLKMLMERAGVSGVSRMEKKDVRGYDHGWINLGLRGKK